MPTPEEKVNHLLNLYNGDYNQAINHAQDCYNHCDIDNEPLEVKQLFENVLTILNEQKPQ